MKAVLDVHYGKSRALAVCVVFQNWQDGEPERIVRKIVPVENEYRPGRFFERELPCLLAVLTKTEEEFETLIIDGYVHLKPGSGKGLGLHLYGSLPYKAEVIGVAKNPLRIADRFTPLFRGRSRKPLYISAAGCSLTNAALSVAGMHGAFRIPTLLRIADQQARRSG